MFSLAESTVDVSYPFLRSEGISLQDLFIGDFGCFKNARSALFVLLLDYLLASFVKLPPVCPE